MTKIYLGNDSYEIHLDSGKSFILTQSELSDIVDSSDAVTDIIIDLDEYKELSEKFNEMIAEIEVKTKEYQSDLLNEKRRTKYKDLVENLLDDILSITEDNL